MATDNIPDPPAPFPVSGRVGGVLPQQQAGMQQSAQRAKPVYDALSNVMSIPNVTGALVGARLRDRVAGRPMPQWQLVNGKLQPPDPNSETTKFMNRFNKGPADAVNEYFATSPQTMKAISKDPGTLGNIGKYFVKHPTENAGLDLIGRIADMGNAGAAGAVKAVTGELSAAPHAIASELNNVVTGIPHLEKPFRPLINSLQSSEWQHFFGLGPGSRFAEVRSTSEDLARKNAPAGLSPDQLEAHVRKAGDDAVLSAANIVNSGARARGRAQLAAREVFGGLTKGEQFDLMNMIEGESPLMGHPSALSAEQAALRNKLAPRLAAYRKWNAQLDADAIKYRVAGVDRFLNNRNFFSRAGMYMNPADEEGEEALADTKQFQKDFMGGKTVSGPRKGSLGQNIHRRYNTHMEALRNGAVLKADATPMKAFEMRVYSRTQAARINEQLDNMQRLGMIVPKQVPVRGAVGVMHDIAQPEGFEDFKELPPDIGGAAVRQFGSDITRDAWVHPTVPRMIQDVAARVEGGGLKGPLKVPLQIMQSANRLLSMFEVSDPLYHPLFNVSENVASEAPSVMGMLRGLRGGKQAIEHMEQVGAALPYASDQAAHLWGRPWSDLSPAEKIERMKASITHGPEQVTRKALYSGIEPKMAAAAFYGLRNRLGETGAALRVRSMLGEPENLRAGLQGWSQLWQFPGWTFSQLRRWPAAIAARPWLYNAPQAAIRDRNLSQGLGPQQTDDSKVLPPIVLGKTPKGDFRVLDIPHPGNRAVSAMDAAIRGDWTGLGWSLSGAVSPLAQGPVYAQMEKWSSQQKHDLAYVAPRKSLLEKGEQTVTGFGRFSPLRGLVAPPDVPPDPDAKTPPDKTPWFLRDVPKAAGPPMTRIELSPERKDAMDRIINAALKGGYDRALRKRVPGLTQIRADQYAAERAGNEKQLATKLRMSADALYMHLMQRLTKEGYPTP